jgi:hypothetical protein
MHTLQETTKSLSVGGGEPLKTEVVADHRGGVGGATRQWGRRRVAGRWFNADSGSGAPTIELGFGGWKD